VGAAAVLYVIGSSTIKPSHDSGLQRYAKGSLHRLQTPAETRRAPSTSFRDAEGRPVRIAELPGEVVVVNLWATWCAPCKTEMPTLAALQRAHPGRVRVVAVSLDTVAKAPEARAFIAAHPPLVFHHDPNYALASATKAQGLPATIIYGPDRLERARVLGAAEWDSPEARRLFEALLAP
jgi:thiol-disulfide isomerase/thioredoxin